MFIGTIPHCTVLAGQVKSRARAYGAVKSRMRKARKRVQDVVRSEAESIMGCLTLAEVERGASEVGRIENRPNSLDWLECDFASVPDVYFVLQGRGRAMGAMRGTRPCIRGKKTSGWVIHPPLPGCAEMQPSDLCL
jgi:hypothetical protein